MQEHEPVPEPVDLEVVVASQREVIARMQAERAADHATIERLSDDLARLLRSDP